MYTGGSSKQLQTGPPSLRDPKRHVGHIQGHGSELRSTLCYPVDRTNLPVAFVIRRLKRVRSRFYGSSQGRHVTDAKLAKPAGTTEDETHALEIEVLARCSLHACRDCLELSRQAFRLGENLGYSPLRVHSSNERHVSPKVCRAFLRAETIDDALEGRSCRFSWDKPQRMPCAQQKSTNRLAT